MNLLIPKRLYANKAVIIALLIFFFPVGLFLMWKFTDWSKKTKWIVSAAVTAILIIGFIGALISPPSVTVANAKNNKINTDNAEYILAGDVSSLNGANLTINDQSVPLTDSNKFSYNLLLKEGDNTISLVSTNKNGETKEVVIVHRTTQAEFAARTEAERLMSDKRTQEEINKESDANAKSEAEHKAQQEKIKREAEAKAKEQAQKAKIAQDKVTKESKTKKRFSFHWPFGKSDQAKAKEQAQKAKIAQDKVTAAANARRAIINRIAPIYCEKRKSVKVKLTAEGEANGWPSNDGTGWTSAECTIIISKLFDSGATEQELDLVADGKYAIGMHEMSLLYSVGSPRDINTTSSFGYKRSQYVYGDPLYNATYIYVENGTVTTVQN
jgi:colicin import membrane protein